MQNNKLFITGGSGFVGSHILSQLVIDGFSCIALYRNNLPSVSGPEWVNGNLLKPGEYENHLDEVNTIVHVAGMVSCQKKDRDKLLCSNYLATKELVNLALHKGVQNIVFISSASTFIRSVNPNHISIKATGNPVFNSYYARTKFLAELEIWRAAAEGMNVCILHPSLVIGKWNWNLSSMKLFGKVKSGLSYYPPGNLGIVAATDLACIVSEICKEGISGQQILVNAEVWSFKELLNEIAFSLNQKPIQKEASLWMAKAIMIIDAAQSKWNGNQTLISGETIKTSFTKFSYEQSLANQSINFKYRDIQKLIHELVSNYSSTIS